MGWPGGWSDPTASGAFDANVPLAQRLGDHLFLDELDEALGEIRQRRTGLDKFELIGMDACLMGHLEVFSALGRTRYAVASQETEPALGWAYASFSANCTKTPMSPAQS